MPNYQKMYFELYAELASTIERLIGLQQKMEEEFINSEAAKIVPFEKKKIGSSDSTVSADPNKK